MGTPFSPFWFRNMFDPYKMQDMMGQQQQPPGIRPFDPEEEDWIRFGRNQQQPPTAPAPGVPNVLNAVPIAPPKPMPKEKVQYGPTTYDPSIMYPSPTGETALNTDITPPPFPRSPQSRPTAATGKGLEGMKPVRSSPNLYPTRIDQPISSHGPSGPSELPPLGPDDQVPGLRRGWNEPVYGSEGKDEDHIPSYWRGYPELYANAKPSATQNPPENFMGQPYTGAGEDAEAKEINNTLKYVPQHEWSDRMRALIDSMPQRDQDMSKWRKFGSFLTGFGLGPEAQEKATYAPFYRQMADWKQRLDPTLKGAEMERQENINLRQLVSQENTARIQQQRADSDRLRAEAYQQRVYDQADAARAKQEIDRLRALGGTPFDDPNSKTVWMLYKDGTKKDTGIDSKLVTPAQRQEWELEKIRTQGEQKRMSMRLQAKLGRPGDVEIKESTDPNTGVQKLWAVSKLPPFNAVPVRTNASGELDIEEPIEQPPTGKTAPTATPSFNPSMGGTTPGSKQITVQPKTQPVAEEEMPEEDNQIISGGPNFTQQQQARKVRASQIRSRFPKDIGKWIKTDRNTGLPYVVQPGSFMGVGTGPPQDVADMLNDMLDGKTPIQQGATPGASGRPPGATNKGQMRILGSGKKVWVEP